MAYLIVWSYNGVKLRMDERIDLSIIGNDFLSGCLVIMVGSWEWMNGLTLAWVILIWFPLLYRSVLLDTWEVVCDILGSFPHESGNLYIIYFFNLKTFYFLSFWQENYVNYRPSSAGKDEAKRMDLLARAAESIADGDIINVQIRRHRQWQLSLSSCVASSILP